MWFIVAKYDAYALTYGCNIIDEDTGECISGHAELWSRTQVLSSDDMAAVTNILPSLCLGIDDFVKMKYDNGTYLAHLIKKITQSLLSNSHWQIIFNKKMTRYFSVFY